MGQIFTKALKTSFKNGNPLAKHFNNHTVKLSYATMPSMAMKIGAHNNNIKRKNNETPDNTVKKLCDCPKTKGGGKI